MKKGLLIGGVVLTVLIALGIASYGYAQSQYMANSSVAFGQGYGPGMMGRQGGRGGMMGGRTGWRVRTAARVYGTGRRRRIWDYG